MEPFRPFVDRLVYENRKVSFDRDYKRELIALLQKDVRYGNKRMQLRTALESYTQDVLKSLEDDLHTVRKGGF